MQENIGHLKIEQRRRSAKSLKQTHFGELWLPRPFALLRATARARLAVDYTNEPTADVMRNAKTNPLYADNC
jgi:hypothetical protein